MLVQPQPRDGLGGWALNTRLRQIRDNHSDLLMYQCCCLGDYKSTEEVFPMPCAVLSAGAVVNISTRQGVPKCMEVLALWKSPKTSHKRQIHHKTKNMIELN